MRIFAGILMFAALPLSLQAAELAPRGPRSVSFGAESLRVQGPALDRRARVSLVGGYHHRIDHRLRFDGYLILAPDWDEKSQVLEVDEDFVTVFPALAFTYPYLFRYSAAIGPTLTRSQTTVSHAGGSAEGRGYFDLGGAVRFGVEYAFDPVLELMVSFGAHRRFRANKTDLSLGLTLVYYL